MSPVSPRECEASPSRCSLSPPAELAVYSKNRTAADLWMNEYKTPFPKTYHCWLSKNLSLLTFQKPITVDFPKTYHCWLSKNLSLLTFQKRITVDFPKTYHCWLSKNVSLLTFQKPITVDFPKTYHCWLSKNLSLLTFQKRITVDCLAHEHECSSSGKGWNMHIVRTFVLHEIYIKKYI